MLIYHDEDEWETVTSESRCGWHQAHPGVPYPSCTCSFSVGQKRRDPAEVRRIKAERLRQHEDSILEQAEHIKAARSSAPRGD